MTTEFQAIMYGFIGLALIVTMFFSYTIFCLEQLRKRLDVNVATGEGGSK